MNFDYWLNDEWIKMFMNFDVFDFEKYCRNESDESIRYEDVTLSHDDIKNVIENYYNTKFKKKMIFSFIKAVGQGIMHCYPVVIPQEFYRENEYFRVECDVNMFKRNESYSAVKSRVPSYIYILNDEEIKRIFEIKGYYETMISISPKRGIDGEFDFDIYGRARGMIIKSYGRVLK